MSDLNENELMLSGLDGGNSLAFLAALGTFRVANQLNPVTECRMKWTEHAGAWRPVLVFDRERIAKHEFVEYLHRKLAETADVFAFDAPDKNFKCRPSVFRSYARQIVNDAHKRGDRVAVDFVAAFGTDGAVETRGVNAGNIRKSSLQMMNGGKKQDYIPIMQKLIEKCSAEHIQNTLFQTWAYRDSMVVLNLRWDAVDDRRYALRWDDPSDARTRKTGSQLGANRLGMEAIPLFPTIPVGIYAQTLGFVSHNRDTFFTWPIWSTPIALDVCGSLLSLNELQKKADEISREAIESLGITKVYRCQRYPVDQYQTASFSPTETI